MNRMRLSSLLAPYAWRRSKPGQKSVSLDNMRVAAPCAASWERMAGDDRVRHCAECKLDVYNLSEMTRSEAERLIVSREGRLCVRFHRRQDGTILTRNCPRGLEALARRVSRVAGAALSAMMSLGAAFAQTPQQAGPATKKEQPAQQKDPRIITETTVQGWFSEAQLPTETAVQEAPMLIDQQEEAQLILTVTDPSGAVIPGAKFQLTGKNRQIKFAGKTLPDGNAVVSGVAPGSFVLTIERSGFELFKRKVTIGKDKPEALRVVLKISSVTMGTTVMTSDVHVEHDDASLKTTISGDFLRDLPMR